MHTIRYLTTHDNTIFGELKYTQDIFSEYTKHFHTHFGLALIDDGYLEIIYDKNKPCTLDKHSLAIFNPKQIHRTQTINAKGYYVLFLDINWCQGIQKDFFFEENIINSDVLYRTFRKLFDRIIVDNLSPKESELKAIIKTLFKKYTTTSLQKEKDVIVQLKTYISNHCDDALSTEALARYIGYDKSYLIRFFKNEVGLTPQQYILNEKVNKAKDALTYSKLHSLSTIAVDAGFFDQSHMNRNFKGLFGTSPKNYKNVNIIQD